MSKTLYFNFHLFNGQDDQIKKHAWMVVDNDKGTIEEIGNQDQPKIKSKVNLKGKYVMPGMINVHTHITFNPNSPSGDTDVDEIRSTVRAIRHLHELLESGVTTIRGCGATYNIDIVLEKLRAKGKLKHVPTILPAGKPFGITGGHSDLPNWGYHCDSVDAIRHDVRVGIKKGAKAIKVMATGGVITPQDSMFNPQLSIEDMKTAVEEAHHKGLIVASHAEANPGLKNAIEAGVDSIEHGFEINDEEIDEMLKQKTFLTSTLECNWAMNTNKVPKWEKDKLKKCWSMLIPNIKHAWHRGVPVTVGTDAGCAFTYFDATAKEFELFVKYMAVGNFEALQANVNSAKLIERCQQFNEKIGILKPGYNADFLVLDHDPLKDVKAIQQKGLGVYKKGIKEC
ncbi:amidohydrolase [Philodulcilactobacillus myokoensis]|uniref:Amidohydrolase n=1 Tax=Philodulcilactobacillus myokoensis TaxID=2929573 RepID=A0A9W6B238_9LACO|nr:amidohydrolase family protein [Philodulcilactobacillus myokoensis]GLB47537.1 amidohydrolase [Philodulcilactobacillus myokoensis]